MDKEFNLKEKIWDGICPVPECNCFHQDEHDWLNVKDVQEFIKRLKERGLIYPYGFGDKDENVLMIRIKDIDKLSGFKDE